MPYSSHHADPAPSYDPRFDPIEIYAQHEFCLIHSMVEKIRSGTGNRYPDHPWTVAEIANIQRNLDHQYCTTAGINTEDALVLAITLGLGEKELQIVEFCKNSTFYSGSHLEKAFTWFD